MKKIPVGIVDDHQLFLKCLVLMLDSFGRYEVVVEASNGFELQEKIYSAPILPEIMLIDINMPRVNGVQLTKWLSPRFPAMILVALSMNDKEHTIIEMFRAGCHAYLLKDMHPEKFKKALSIVREKGYLNPDYGDINLTRLITQASENGSSFTKQEMEFIFHSCSELTYKEISVKMGRSEKTVDGYRSSVFLKLHVHSRVGLCMEALRLGLVDPV